MNQKSLLKYVSWIALYVSLLTISPVTAMDTDKSKHTATKPSSSDSSDPSTIPSSEELTKRNQKKRGATDELPSTGQDTSIPEDNSLSSGGNPPALKKAKGPEDLSIASSSDLKSSCPVTQDIQTSPSAVAGSFAPSSMDPASTVVTMDAGIAEVTQQTSVTPLSAATLSAPAKNNKPKTFSMMNWVTSSKKSTEATPSTNTASSSQSPMTSTTTKPAKPLKDAFYIFNAGQGNAQQATYAEGPGEPFAILYDCGSSAETINSKILKALSHNKILNLF